MNKPKSVHIQLQVHTFYDEYASIRGQNDIITAEDIKTKYMLTW